MGLQHEEQSGVLPAGGAPGGGGGAEGGAAGPLSGRRPFSYTLQQLAVHNVLTASFIHTLSLAVFRDDVMHTDIFCRNV